jgi:hypothetical protein
MSWGFSNLQDKLNPSLLLVALLQVDGGSHLVRSVNMSTGIVSTVAGAALTCDYVNGIGTNAQFCSPVQISFSALETVAVVVSAELLVSTGSSVALLITSSAHLCMPPTLLSSLG